MVTEPDDLQTVFLDKNKVFSSNMGYKNNLGWYYDGSIITRDFDDHKVNVKISL